MYNITKAADRITEFYNVMFLLLLLLIMLLFLLWWCWCLYVQHPKSSWQNHIILQHNVIVVAVVAMVTIDVVVGFMVVVDVVVALLVVNFVADTLYWLLAARNEEASYWDSHLSGWPDTKSWNWIIQYPAGRLSGYYCNGYVDVCVYNITKVADRITAFYMVMLLLLLLH